MLLSATLSGVRERSCHFWQIGLLLCTGQAILYGGLVTISRIYVIFRNPCDHSSGEEVIEKIVNEKMKENFCFMIRAIKEPVHLYGKFIHYTSHLARILIKVPLAGKLGKIGILTFHWMQLCETNCKMKGSVCFNWICWKTVNRIGLGNLLEFLCPWILSCISTYFFVDPYLKKPV